VLSTPILYAILKAFYKYEIAQYCLSVLNLSWRLLRGVSDSLILLHKTKDVGEAHKGTLGAHVKQSALSNTPFALFLFSQSPIATPLYSS
jgi:hypothetical protein